VPHRQIPLIGVTGVVGAGKSTALKLFEELGGAVLSTDAVVHELYGSSEVCGAIAEHFGNALISEGEVDRDALAAIVFQDENQRLWLEQLLWPLVASRVVDWHRSLAEMTPAPIIAVVEVPLLFESGIEAMFDQTVAITIDPHVRAERLQGKLSPDLTTRDQRQLSQSEKAKLASYVVTNDGSVQELKRKLSDLLAQLQ
jgi:dephospho-CoA kinase